MKIDLYQNILYIMEQTSSLSIIGGAIIYYWHYYFGHTCFSSDFLILNKTRMDDDICVLENLWELAFDQYFRDQGIAFI